MAFLKENIAEPFSKHHEAEYDSPLRRTLKRLHSRFRRLFHVTHSIEQSEDELYFEVLKSERRRIVAMLVCACFLAAVMLVGIVLLPTKYSPVRRVFGDAFPIYELLGICCFWGLYELLVFKSLNNGLQRHILPPGIVRYGNAFFETSLPSVVMVLLTVNLGAVIALHSPMIMLYGIFITLTTLRLNFMLGLFTGLVAGVEYFALCAYFLPPVQTVSSEWRFFAALQPALSKAMLLIISGAMAGFVGRELRMRLLTSLQVTREKNRVIGMFGQYVSPAVVRQLLDQKSVLDGEVRHVTIMFLDIRDFTAFSETHSPTEVVDYLNTLFGHLITIVNKHDGIINKFLGDGFMAVFGAPISNGKDTVNAVNAALAMATMVDELNSSATIPPTRIGIGVHTGLAVTGSVGSEERKEYTIIGDTVNLASRVEQLNKEFSSTILVTADVAALLDDTYTKEPLPDLFVKGRAEAVTLYKLR